LTNSWPAKARRSTRQGRNPIQRRRFWVNTGFLSGIRMSSFRSFRGPWSWRGAAGAAAGDDDNDSLDKRNEKDEKGRSSRSSSSTRTSSRRRMMSYLGVARLRTSIFKEKKKEKEKREI